MLSGFAPEAALSPIFASISTLACAAQTSMPPCKGLSSLILGKIARFPYENYAASIRGFRMDAIL